MYRIINDIISTIEGLWTGFMSWIDFIVGGFSYFKYIWTLRIKNLFIVILLVVIFLLFIWIFKKIAFGLVDEHYGIKKEKKSSFFQRRRLKKEKKMTATDPASEIEDDQLWYINKKYR